MRKRAVLMPMNYVDKLEEQVFAGRKKAGCFIEYYLDATVGNKQTHKFYAKSWGVHKSMAREWIEEFDYEIKLLKEATEIEIVGVK